MRISTSIWPSFAIISLLHIIISSLTDFGPIFFIAIYPMFIITLPSKFFPNKALILAFIIGITADFFSSTLYGIHSASLVFMAFIQPLILRFFSKKDDTEKVSRIGIDQLGIKSFVFYCTTLVTIHNIAFVYIETMNWSVFYNSLFRLLLSTIINTLIIVIIEISLFSQKK